MLTAIAYRVALSQIRSAWSETDTSISVVNDVQEGIDQDMAATHHNLNEQDMDMMVDEIKDPLSLDMPSHKL